jgi:hypothetical protein
VHSAAALALLLLLTWLRLRSRKVLSDDPEIQASAQVLQRPISSWLVLVLVGLLVLEPDAPMILRQAVLLLALVPVLRLLPREVYAVLGLGHTQPMACTAGTPSFLVPPTSSITALRAVLTLLTLTMTVWLLMGRDGAARGGRTADKVGASRARLPSSCSWYLRLANVVGNVSPQRCSRTACSDSGYVGLVLYAGVTRPMSVLRLLSQGVPFRNCASSRSTPGRC